MKSINRNQGADFRFSKHFWFLVPFFTFICRILILQFPNITISRAGTNARFAPLRQARRQALRFGGKMYIFKGASFFYCYVLTIKRLTTQQNFGGHKKWGTLLPNAAPWLRFALWKPVKVAHRNSLRNKLSVNKFPVIWQP